MRYVIASTQSGEIVRVVTCDEDQASMQAMQGEVIFQSENASAATHYVVDRKLIAYTDEERATKASVGGHSPGGVWSNSEMRWADGRPPEVQAAAARADINNERMRASYAPVEFRGARFDAGPEARAAILNWQVQLLAGAQLPLGFVWRDANNVDHPADGDFLNGLGAAIAMRDSLLRAQTWARKGELGG